MLDKSERKNPTAAQSFKVVSLKNGTLTYRLCFAESMIEIEMPNSAQLNLPLDGKKVNWPKLLDIVVQLENLNPQNWALSQAD